MADSRITSAVGGAGQGATIGAKIGGPWGAAIGGILGGVGGFLSGGGEDDAKKLAKMQADIIMRTSAENQRVMRRQMERDVGFSRAAVAASNILETGSSARFIKGMEDEWRRNMAWERGKARTEARMARKGGQIAASKIEAAGLSAAIGGIGAAAGAGLFGSYTKDGYKWDPWG